MKQVLIRFLLACCIALLTLLNGSMAMAASQPQIKDIGRCAVPDASIDLNNANLMAFTDCPGFYPNLAAKILSHGPYQAVDDVLSIPDLGKDQKRLLKANLKSFTVNAPAVPLEKRMPPRINQPAH